MFYLKNIYLYFSIGNGQPKEPTLCQLYWHTFVPYMTTKLNKPMRMPVNTFAKSASTYQFSRSTDEVVDNVVYLGVVFHFACFLHVKSLQIKTRCRVHVGQQLR